MALEVPAWLKQRGLTLKQGSDGVTWYALHNEQPLYSLAPVPVSGKFGSALKQVNNGKRLETSGAYPTADEALRAGLEDLRKALGW